MRRDPRNAALVLALMLASAMPAQGNQTTPAPQEPVTEEVESDSDPARPVFFSIRPEFYNFGDSVGQRVLIVRFDAALAPTRRMGRGLRGIVARVDVPVVGADVHGEHVAGMGDAYAQFFIVPYVKGAFAWAVGGGFILPTASDVLTGCGKLVIAPVVAPMWRLPRTLFFVKIQNFTSVAGDSDRPDLNYLLVTPTFIRALQRVWWVLVDSETKTTWTDDGVTGIRSGVQVGRRIAPQVALWVKPEVWWGPNRDGTWNLKLGLVWYRPPATAQGEPATDAAR